MPHVRRKSWRPRSRLGQRSWELGAESWELGAGSWELGAGSHGNASSSRLLAPSSNPGYESAQHLADLLSGGVQWSPGSFRDISKVAREKKLALDFAS